MFLSLPNIFGQVVIKERVKVGADTEQKVTVNATESNTATYSLYVEMDYSMIEYEAGTDHNEVRETMILVYGPADTIIKSIDWEPEYHRTLTITAKNCIPYNFRLGLNLYDGDVAELSYNFYINGVSYLSGRREVQGSRLWNHNHTTITIHPTNEFDFELRPYGFCQDDCDQSSNLYLYEKRISSSHQYLLRSPITYTVTEGGEYANFADIDMCESVGTSVRYDWVRRNLNGINRDYYLKIVNPNMSYDNATITVKAEVGSTTGIVESESSITVSTILDGRIVGNDLIVINEKTKINAWLASSICGQDRDIPDGTTFEAVIVTGENFGSLVNPNTGEIGDRLSNIVVDGNILELEFFANEDNPTTYQEDINIEISCSIPNVEPLGLSLEIKSSELVVTTVPEALSSGDTANVILKYKREDGTLIDFPTDQWFDVEIIGGADYGNFLVGGEIGEAFYGVEEDIKLVANKDIVADNAEMSIKASTIYYPPVDGNMRKHKKIKVGSKGKKDKTQWFEPIVGVVNVKIKSPCGEHPCEEEIRNPELKTKQVLVCDVCAEPKQRGVFKPIWNSLNSPYTVKICFNRNNETWNYGIENDKIFYKYQLTNCLINQRRLYSKLVKDIDGVNRTDIPEEDFCEAYKSFVSQKRYGGGGPRYFISEATAEHEKVHKRDWENMLNELSSALKYAFILEKPTCAQFDNYEDALSGAKKYIDGSVKDFNKLFRNTWSSKIGKKKNSDERKEYEQDTQDKVEYLIDGYIEKLENLYPYLMKDNCKK